MFKSKAAGDIFSEEEGLLTNPVEKLEKEVAEEFETKGVSAQFERDAELWYNFLQSPGDKRLGNVMRRIFMTLRFGGLMYRTSRKEKAGWKAWRETKWPIAAALSHGGRVIIQLPPSTKQASKPKPKTSVLNQIFGKFMTSTGSDETLNDDSFWTWILTGETDSKVLDQFVSVKTSGDEARSENKIVFKRLGATHALSYVYEPTGKEVVHGEDDEEELQKEQSHATTTSQKNSKIEKLPFERKKMITEVKTTGVNARDTKILRSKEVVLKKHRHWGMNIALGGAGNPAQGAVKCTVQPNGSHGHVYLYFMSSGVHRPGGIMIGVEGSEYNKPDQTGSTHGLSAHSPVLSPTFGYKWRGKKEGKNLIKIGGPDKYDSLFIDLSSTNWGFIRSKQWDDKMVYQTAEDPPTHSVLDDEFAL